MRFKYVSYIFAIVFVVGCSPKGKFILSEDGKHHLTLYEKTDNEGKSYTFIVYGKLKPNHDLNSESYIKVRNRYTDAWYCLISWEGAKAVIYQPYSNFEGKNLNNKLELREMRDKEFSKIFFSKEKDSYIRLSSYNKKDLK